MKFIGFRRHHLGFRCNRTRTAAAAILLLGFFIVVFAGNFSAREVAPVEVERELEPEILHEQWSLNKTAPRERVVDSKKLLPEKKTQLRDHGCSTKDVRCFLEPSRT